MLKGGAEPGGSDGQGAWFDQPFLEVLAAAAGASTAGATRGYNQESSDHLGPPFRLAQRKTPGERIGPPRKSGSSRCDRTMRSPRLRFRLNHFYQGPTLRSSMPPTPDSSPTRASPGLHRGLQFVAGCPRASPGRPTRLRRRDLGARVVDPQRGGSRPRCLFRSMRAVPAAWLPPPPRAPRARRARRRRRCAGPMATPRRGSCRFCWPETASSVRYRSGGLPAERDRLVAAREVLAATCFDSTLKFAMRMRVTTAPTSSFSTSLTPASTSTRAQLFASPPFWRRGRGLAEALCAIVRTAWQDCAKIRTSACVRCSSATLLSTRSSCANSWNGSSHGRFFIPLNHRSSLR